MAALVLVALALTMALAALALTAPAVALAALELELALALALAALALALAALALALAELAALAALAASVCPPEVGGQGGGAQEEQDAEGQGYPGGLHLLGSSVPVTKVAAVPRPPDWPPASSAVPRPSL